MDVALMIQKNIRKKERDRFVLSYMRAGIGMTKSDPL